MTTTGKVRWFNAHKGYGFIIPDDATKDVFLHARELRQSGIEPTRIQPDTKLAYAPTEGPRGIFATGVKLAT